MDERDKKFIDPQSTKKMNIQRDQFAPNETDMGATKKIGTITPNVQNTQKNKVKKRKAPAKKTSYAIFLVTTVFVGIVAAVFTFAMMFNEIFTEEGFSFGSSSASSNVPNVSPSPSPSPDDDIAAEQMPVAPGTITAIGLVQEINQNTNRMDIYVFEDSQMRSFFAEGHSALRDKFGIAMTFDGFRTGDVVEIAYFEGSTSIEIARISPQVFTYLNVFDVVIEPANQMLLIGARRYSYSPRTVVRYHGTEINITDISPVDVISVDTFDGQVVFVDVHRGNGNVFIPRNDLIIRGIVEIGNSVFTLLENDMNIPVAEGEHTVIVRGDNIEPLDATLTVTRGGTTNFSFDGLTLRDGSVTVNINDNLAMLTIDGRIHPTNQPVVLEFGTHSITVEREGFVPFNQDVTISAASPAQEITVVLEEIVLTRNVIIITSPPGARVYLDGTYMGIAPVGAYLEYRRYSLSLALDGFVDVSLDIWVTEETPVFSFPMVPDFSSPPIIFD